MAAVLGFGTFTGWAAPVGVGLLAAGWAAVSVCVRRAGGGSGVETAGAVIAAGAMAAMAIAMAG